MKKLLVYITCLLIIFSKPVFADEGWVIDSFRDDIVIQADGKVSVKEQIEVDFKTLSKHGIYRDLPLMYQDSNNKKTYTTLDHIAVEQDATPATFTIEKNESNERIKIGDANKTLSGKHIYTITYVATGILRSFDDHDELYWNVTGNAWDVPITHASASVTLSTGNIIKTTCFQGITGSSTPCLTSSSGQKATFDSDRLSADEGLTIVVGFPKGLVPMLTVTPPPSLLVQLLSPLPILAFILPILIGTFFIGRKWSQTGRDFWFKNSPIIDSATSSEVIPVMAHETIVVEFTPPQSLRPAEIGVLIDQKADTLDVTATIIDLAVRGFLTITEVEKKWLFGSKDYELQKKTKDIKELYSYEEKLLSSLFSNKTTVLISSLKTTFYDDLADVKKKLYAHMTSNKYFVDNPETIRNKYTTLGVLIIFLGGSAFFFAPLRIGISFLYPLLAGTILTGVIILMFSRIMPRRTAIGRDLYRRSFGYKEFLSKSEKYRQQFFEKQNMLNDMLPYAMVFGVTEKFAKAMADMGVASQQPSWYSSTHPFYVNTFARDINTFSQALSVAMATTPSKSGGFSGGSSGGGFGGGGGGSW